MPAFRLAPVALGTLVCAALIGCASVEPRAGAAWRIEPLMRVSHGGDPANGRAYAALGEAYQGEGRWQEAAEATRRQPSPTPRTRRPSTRWASRRRCSAGTTARSVPSATPSTSRPKARST